jgi:DNA-binding MarR family transcriptional regulator
VIPAVTAWRNSAFDLRREITATAEAIANARSVYDEQIIRVDAAWRVVEAVAHSHYCLSIADAARVLGVARQTAHPFVRAAAREGLLNLEPNPDDRRILQLILTARGKAELNAADARESTWLNVLLNGLADRDMATAAHVLRIIRQRLQRDARDLARRRRQG